MGEAPVREDSTVTRSAEYVGSFPVDDNCLDDQIKQLHTQLKSLKACKRRRPVSLKFSIKGVKMYNEDETILLMAHALRRISLSTARPVDSQFAFVAHNPGCPDTQLYCHVFKARHARAVRILHCSVIVRARSKYVFNAFCLLLSHAGQKKTPKSSDDQQSSQDEVFPISSPSLMRKKVIRTKVLRSGAYRSFTFTPRKQRTVQDQLSVTQGGPSVHRALSRFKELISETIPGSKLGRNRRGTSSGSVVLGWYRNVSISHIKYIFAFTSVTFLLLHL
uniref:PID domain-containing protein n=1 Tax=Oreochromis niloticus TaxID=8128 RepID=A0A669C4A2_ORENI